MLHQLTQPTVEMTQIPRCAAHGRDMTSTMSRTDITVLRRRMRAVGRRISIASTVAAGVGGHAFIISPLTLAWLFTGHMGEFEPLRLFVITLTATLVIVALAAWAVLALSKSSLNRAQDTLIRAGVHVPPEPTYLRGPLYSSGVPRLCSSSPGTRGSA